MAKGSSNVTERPVKINPYNLYTTPPIIATKGYETQFKKGWYFYFYNNSQELHAGFALCPYHCGLVQVDLTNNLQGYCDCDCVEHRQISLIVISLYEWNANSVFQVWAWSLWFKWILLSLSYVIITSPCHVYVVQCLWAHWYFHTTLR